MTKLMKHAPWVPMAILLLLVGCGGDESSKDSSTDETPNVAADRTAELPSSADEDDYDRLVDELDQQPDRVIPYVPPADRLTFASPDEARDAFIEAIADGDTAHADRIFASTDVETRNTLLMAAGSAGNEAYYADDHTRAYRLEHYVKIDFSQLWQLEGAYLRGRVVDAATSIPVSGAELSTQLPNVTPTQSDAAGNFELFVPEQLAHILLVNHPRYEQHSQYETNAGHRLKPDELDDEFIEVRLSALNNEPQPELPSLTLRGQVLDAETGEPLPEVAVVVAPAGNNAFDIAMKNYGVTTDSEGRFEIRELTAAEVGMHAQGVHDGKMYFRNEESFTFSDNVEQVIRIEGRRGKLEVPLVVVGHVRDRSTGAPVANARVSAGGWKAERTGSDGRFLIQLDTGKDWQLTADHEEYHESAAQAFSSPTPQKFETEFLLDPITTGTILGTAINSLTGEPIVNAVIEIAGQRIRTDRAGRFKLEEVESGEITVNAAQSGFRSDAESIVLEALQTAEATLQLEPITTGTIRGVVIDAETGAPIAEAAVAAGDQRATTDSDGRFVLENVEAGMLEVAASKTLYVPNATDAALEAMAEIETEIRLTPITWGTVSGTVRDATTGTALANTDVRIGGGNVTTNAQGEYIAERVPAGSISATASLPRYYDDQARIELPRDGTLQQDFELEPITTGTVAGIVRNASTGEQIAGATVTIGARAARTAADGTFELGEVPAGRLTVNAAADVYEPGSVKLVLDAAGKASAELILVPITYGTVSGKITNASTGAPLSNADVRIADRAVRTKADGTYLMEQVPAGEISVSAERGRFYPAQETTQLLAAAEVEVDLGLDPITTGTVTGVVRDAATGRPLAGVNVQAGSQGARSNAAGAFTIENVAAGDVTLRASATLYESGETDVTVEAAETVSTELALTPVTYGTVTGRVVEAGTGRPLADAEVLAGRQHVRTDADGRFTLEKVPAGSHRVAASKPVNVDNGKSIELAAGESRELSIELEPITWGSVRGVVKDAETGAPLRGVEVMVGATKLHSDASGEFAVERVKAGALQVSAKLAAYKSASQRVELPAAGEQTVTLELEPIKIGNVEGQVLDAKTGEPIAQARVTIGSRATETDSAGKFIFADVDTGRRIAAAKHPDYANGSASVDVLPVETVNVIVRLDLRREDVANLESELAKSGTIDLYGIYFDSGKDQFKPSSLATLQAVLQVMKRAPERRFQLAGHTDSDGGDDYNQNLSERRAKRVIEWLVDNGIDSGRLDAVGFGETRPVAPNDTESGKALNRRAQLSFAR